jgi:hypothetical protein
MSSFSISDLTKLQTVKVSASDGRLTTDKLKVNIMIISDLVRELWVSIVRRSSETKRR